MDQFANTILAKDWQGRYQFPNVEYRENGDGSRTLVRSNSVGVGGTPIRPHHVTAIKAAFKKIRKENTNPRALKKINRDYLRCLRGNLSVFYVVEILGDYQTKIKPPRIHVERESKTEAAAVA